MQLLDLKPWHIPLRVASGAFILQSGLSVTLDAGARSRGCGRLGVAVRRPITGLAGPRTVAGFVALQPDGSSSFLTPPLSWVSAPAGSPSAGRASVGTGAHLGAQCPGGAWQAHR